MTVKLLIDSCWAALLRFSPMESVEFQFAILPDHVSLVSNLLALGLLLSPSG